MVTRDTPWPPGSPCWVALAVDNMDTAGDFYRRLFGWEIQESPDGGYAICLKNGRAVAGMVRKQDEQGTPAAWTPYLASDDVDETVTKVRAAGGQVLQEPRDFMDASRVALASDSAGAVFGIWQARTLIGVGLVDEPGSLAWVENFSSDFKRTRFFYQEVFGYNFTDIRSEEPRYAIMNLDGRLIGGISELPSNPAQWSVGFAVDDPYKIAADVANLGGSVEHPPMETPFGAAAVLKDKLGTTFFVMTMSVVRCPHGNPTLDASGACMASPPCP
jgi:uncharacterized protein